MRVYIIDTTHMTPELKSGLIGVDGTGGASTEQLQECIETLSRYADDGWAIAADPHTIIGRLAALTAHAAGVPFVTVGNARFSRSSVSTIMSTRGRNPDSARPLPLVPGGPLGRQVTPNHSGFENGGW